MKYFTILLVLFTGLFAEAQTNRGSFLIAGKISLAHDKNTSGSSTATTNSFYFSPSVGYFPINHLCVGLTLPFSLSSYKSNVIGDNAHESTQSSSTLTLGPFVRYYVPLTEKFFLLGEVTYSWGSGHTKYSSYTWDGFAYTRNEGNIKYDSKVYEGNAGISYFLSRNIGVELLGGFSKNNAPSSDNASFHIRGGFQIYIPK